MNPTPDTKTFEVLVQPNITICIYKRKHITLFVSGKAYSNPTTNTKTFEVSVQPNISVRIYKMKHITLFVFNILESYYRYKKI